MRVLIMNILVLLVILPYFKGDRIIERFNSYRSRAKLPGLRKLYFDEGLKVLAQKATDECKKMNEDGDYGVFYTTEASTSEALMADGMARKAYSTSRDPMNLEDRQINFFAPRAYKIGCSYNENCSPGGLYLCYVNSKFTHDEFKPVTEFCGSCSKTFSKCEKQMCIPEDDKIPQRVIEDEPVDVQTNEPEKRPSDLTGDVNLVEISDSVENNGFIVSFGLINSLVIIFHLLGN